MAPERRAGLRQDDARARSGVVTATAGEAAVLARAAMDASLDPADPDPLRWLERAHRLVPSDPNVALALASACLGDDPARAEGLFRSVLERHDVRQAWLGLAAARLRRSGPDEAAEALTTVLSR